MSQSIESIMEFRDDRSEHRSANSTSRNIEAPSSINADPNINIEHSTLLHYPHQLRICGCTIHPCTCYQLRLSLVPATINPQVWAQLQNEQDDIHVSVQIYTPI
jgi:hypothetical protein